MSDLQQSSTEHARMDIDTLLYDHIRVMSSDSDREWDEHDQGRRRMCPSRTTRHLMSLRGRDQSALGGEFTRDVTGLTADGHGSSGSRVGSTTQLEQPRQMVRQSGVVDDGQPGYDPLDDDVDSTIEGEEEGADRQTVHPLAGDYRVTEEQQRSDGGWYNTTKAQQRSSLVGNFEVTMEQRSSAPEAGRRLHEDHSYSATIDDNDGQTGSTSKAASMPADGSCSDEITDTQLRQTMDVLRDQSDYDELHQHRVDALPLEVSHAGGEYDFVGQTDDLVSQQRTDLQCDGIYWKSESRGSRSTKTTSGLTGPVMSSRETSSVSLASYTEAHSGEGIVNNVGSVSHQSQEKRGNTRVFLQY